MPGGFTTPGLPGGGTIAGPLTVSSPSDSAVALHVTGGSTNTVGIDLTVDPANSRVTITGLDNNPLLRLANDFSADYAQLSDSGISIVSGGAAVFGASNVGVVIAVHSAPADLTVAAGQCFLWFDQTNGAAKLMIKAKQADGTVRTGSVNLA